MLCGVGVFFIFESVPTELNYSSKIRNKDESLWLKIILIRYH